MNFPHEKVVPLPGEEWRDVVGYEGMYKVSNLGRVSSVRNNGWYLMHPHITKFGYKRVMFKTRPTSKQIFVHRLVADAFIPNPNKYKFINHKDEIRTNNDVDNLEWCTRQYNNTYGGALHKAHRTRMKNGFTNVIVVYDLSGNALATYESTYKAAKCEGCSYSSISGCISGRRYMANGKIYLRQEEDVLERINAIRSLPMSSIVKIFAANRISDKVYEFTA